MPSKIQKITGEISALSSVPEEGNVAGVCQKKRLIGLRDRQGIAAKPKQDNWGAMRNNKIQKIDKT